MLVDSRNPFLGCEIGLKSVFRVSAARRGEVLGVLEAQTRKLKAAIITITFKQDKFVNTLSQNS